MTCIKPSLYDDFQLTRVKDYVIAAVPRTPMGEFCQAVWDRELIRDYGHSRRCYQSPAIAEMPLNANL